MNRIGLQEIAELRLQESRALLAAGFPDGAYYLAGYVVECALKACIAKRTREHDFPEKKLANDSHTHNLKELLRLAELKIELDTMIAADPAWHRLWIRFKIGQRPADTRGRLFRMPRICSKRLKINQEACFRGYVCIGKLRY